MSDNTNDCKCEYSLANDIFARNIEYVKKKTELMSDVVNHPEHYISDSGIETIDVIKAFTRDIKDPFEAYCTGNIIKYICRWPNKNGVEDLKKARWYLDKLIDNCEFRLSMEKTERNLFSSSQE